MFAPRDVERAVGGVALALEGGDATRLAERVPHVVVRDVPVAMPRRDHRAASRRGSRTMTRVSTRMATARANVVMASIVGSFLERRRAPR
jgi:hypothetical protein